MSFGATANAFKTLAVAQSGESYEVEVVKNDKGYNDWVSMTKGGAADVSQQPASGAFSAPRSTTSAPRSTYETPEERAARQVYIVKQSSIGAAIATLSVGAKAVKQDDVITMAQKYTDFVFGKPGSAGGATGFDDVPDLDPAFQAQVD